MGKVVLRGGTVFDGTGAPPKQADVEITDGVVTKIGDVPAAEQEIDCAGQWVMPGFIDIHTHYDAEVLLAPGLTESLRHGVTTVFMGSCSISMIHAEAEDASDIFTRVESIPREYVLPALRTQKTWRDAEGFIRPSGRPSTLRRCALRTFRTKEAKGLPRV